MKTIYFVEPAKEINVLALERFLGIEVGDGGYFINLYTDDPRVVDRAVRILGDAVEEVA